MLLPLPDGGLAADLGEMAYDRVSQQLPRDPRASSRYEDVRKSIGSTFEKWIGAFRRGERLDQRYSLLYRRHTFWGMIRDEFGESHPYMHLYRLFSSLEYVAVGRSRSEKRIARSALTRGIREAVKANVLSREGALKVVIDHYPYPPSGFGDLVERAGLLKTRKSQPASADELDLSELL